MKLWLIDSRIFENWILFKYLNIVQMFEYVIIIEIIGVRYALFE